ncbi:MAG: glycosyltransferase [Chloroflexi bacterium]|nr:glycosyltransferase [Chloroflexota bacterium]
MKLLVVVSSLDLRQPFSATPAWWQLLKGLYELGVEVIAAPYQGAPIESLWWRAEENPARIPGDAFKSLRELSRAILPAHRAGSARDSVDESLADKAVRQVAHTVIAPLWRRHLERILIRERDVDAILFLTVPLNHLPGLPKYISSKFDIPIFYFDGDVPASLPNMRGFASGFRIYQGADLSEYTAFISNSSGGGAMLRQLGAENVHTVWYGADPDVFAPVSAPAQDIDVLFYGHGREYRSDWIDRMITAPSKALSGTRFAVRGANLGDLGAAEQLPYLSFSKLREYVCRSKLNLCITRGAHASVHASSSSRPFELGALGACIVANPYLGIEEWFEPEQELVVVNSAAEALERYRYLLSNDKERLAIGRAARQRVLKQHTFRHRARDLMDIVKSYM